jgi:hypothetical protein
VAKDAKATNAAKAAKATKDAKATNDAKAAKASNATKATKATKDAKADRKFWRGCSILPLKLFIRLWRRGSWRGYVEKKAEKAKNAREAGWNDFYFL